MKGRLFLGQTNELQNDSRLKAQRTVELCNLFDDPEFVSSEPGTCGFRAEKGKPMVYLVGDSHIHQYRHAIATYTSRHGLGLHGVWGNACPFPDLNSWASSPDPRKQLCQQQQRVMTNKVLSAVKPGDIIFIGNYLTAYFDPVNAGPAFKEAIQDYSARLREVSEILVAKGATVLFTLMPPDLMGWKACQRVTVSPNGLSLP